MYIGQASAGRSSEEGFGRQVVKSSPESGPHHGRQGAFHPAGKEAQAEAAFVGRPVLGSHLLQSVATSEGSNHKVDSLHH